MINSDILLTKYEFLIETNDLGQVVKHLNICSIKHFFKVKAKMYVKLLAFKLCIFQTLHYFVTTSDGSGFLKPEIPPKPKVFFYT